MSDKQDKQIQLLKIILRAVRKFQEDRNKTHEKQQLDSLEKEAGKI
ncbi:MAG: hypothetical protein WCT46_04455 [Candidatus Gracilibacteria bacterium]|jgi:hypothetical protein